MRLIATATHLEQAPPLYPILTRSRSYANVVEMEIKTMIDMIQQHILPSAIGAERAGIEMPADATIGKLKEAVGESGSHW